MFVGIDIGGTKVELCRFSSEYQLISCSKVSTTSLHPGNPDFWSNFTNIVVQFITPHDELVGIAMKGIVHEQEVVYSSLLGGEVRTPIAAQLAEVLGKPVLIDNDIRPLARAESRFGHARGVQSFAVVNIGTGLGIIHVEGSLIKGYRSLAGQIDLVRCWVEPLNRFETFENVMSGAGIASLYKEIVGTQADAQWIFAQAQKGNEDAQKVVDIFIQTTARFLSHVSYFYNPEIIILHGSVRYSLPVIFQRLWQRYKDETDPLSHAREIKISSLEHAHCLGAVLEV